MAVPGGSGSTNSLTWQVVMERLNPTTTPTSASLVQTPVRRTCDDLTGGLIGLLTSSGLGLRSLASEAPDR